MSIVSNYIWEKAADGGRNPVSLVLQQVRLRGREIGLFCVCDSGPREELGGRMTEQMVEWFHRTCLPACGGRTLPAPREMLEPELRCIQEELSRPESYCIQEEMSRMESYCIQEELSRSELHCIQKEVSWPRTWNYGGLLLMGSSFYLFGEGDIEVQLVNYRYNRPQLRKLDFPLYGRIQRGVGVLIHTPQFLRNLKPEEVCQLLHGEGKWPEERIGRRLKELCQEGRSRGNTEPVGGIYLQVL